MEKGKRVYLIGNPNCGKTTLFNILSGEWAQTGNYEGVTIQEKETPIVVQGQSYALIDLPGTYSLNPRTHDEKIAVQAIHQLKANDKVLYVADAHSLKLQLFLLSQLIDKGLDVALILNYIHHPSQVTLDIAVLEKQLGVPIYVFDQEAKVQKDLFFTPILKAKELISAKANHTVMEHYNRVNSWLTQSSYKIEAWSRLYARFNALTTHSFWGLILFFCVLYGVFQVIFSIAEYPMNWIEGIFELSAQYVKPLFKDHWMGSLVADGVLSGLAGVVVFVPQIALLFFLLELLNQSGYLPRASYLLDGLLKKIGLSGKSVIPIMSGYACAVPAIMATRTIKNPKERLISILILPFITCSARLPVYMLVIGLVIPSTLYFGVFNLQSITLFVLYLLGVFMTLISSIIIGRFIPSQTPNYFMMQMPRFTRPDLSQIFKAVWIKVSDFIWQAGKYILLTSMILWVLGNTGPRSSFYSGTPPAIQDSYLGAMGKAIAPIIKPLGYDWKIGISIISSFAAREVFVGTMATIYGLEEEDETSILQSMKTDRHSDGTRIYTLATGLSLLLFYAFSLQCISTIAVVKRETGGWKWPILQLIGMTLMGYLSAMAAYQIFS